MSCGVTGSAAGEYASLPWSPRSVGPLRPRRFVLVAGRRRALSMLGCEIMNAVAYRPPQRSPSAVSLERQLERGGEQPSKADGCRHEDGDQHEEGGRPGRDA